MLSFSVEIAIENITYKYEEYDETVWCRENW